MVSHSLSYSSRIILHPLYLFLFQPFFLTDSNFSLHLRVLFLGESLGYLLSPTLCSFRFPGLSVIKILHQELIIIVCHLPLNPVLHDSHDCICLIQIYILMPSRAIVHHKFPIKIYLINNYYLLMKKLDFVLGIGFVGLFPKSCIFHTVGGLLPGYKTSSGSKDGTSNHKLRIVLSIFLS